LVPGLVGRRQPLQLVAPTIALGFGLTIEQAVYDGAWMAVVHHRRNSTRGIAVPLIDSSIVRASEHAADR